MESPAQSSPSRWKDTVSLVLGIVLGCVGFIRVLGIAFFDSDVETVNREVHLWWYTGALCVCFAAAFFNPRGTVASCLGFVMPIGLWCLSCTVEALEDTALLWWIKDGLITLVIGLVAQYAGRYLSKVLGMSMTIRPKPRPKRTDCPD